MTTKTYLTPREWRQGSQARVEALLRDRRAERRIERAWSSESATQIAVSTFLQGL